MFLRSWTIAPRTTTSTLTLMVYSSPGRVGAGAGSCARARPDTVIRKTTTPSHRGEFHDVAASVYFVAAPRLSSAQASVFLSAHLMECPE